MSLALVAAACTADDEEAVVTTEAESTETTMESEEAMADEPGTIVDVAVANGDFTTLVAAVQAADLVDTLNGEGPFTVFAPTDEAFAAALDALGLTAEELLADTDLLTSVLTYHVIPGEVMAETVVTLDGESVTTVNGADVTIGVDGDAVTVNDANVIAVDVDASNGVIHVIDAVLLPPAQDSPGSDRTSEERAPSSNGARSLRFGSPDDSDGFAASHSTADGADTLRWVSAPWRSERRARQVVGAVFECVADRSSDTRGRQPHRHLRRLPFDRTIDETGFGVWRSGVDHPQLLSACFTGERFAEGPGCRFRGTVGGHARKVPFGDHTGDVDDRTARFQPRERSLGEHDRQERVREEQLLHRVDRELRNRTERDDADGVDDDVDLACVRQCSRDGCTAALGRAQVGGQTRPWPHELVQRVGTPSNRGHRRAPGLEFVTEGTTDSSGGSGEQDRTITQA
eukprot:snap_masked-scaffold7487_size3159-processed-gene-0.1 protein:Tk10200 transcript:snap_masked-scaffold7487_size3159-processed-gene-0.1-mRNA-1 annotation:"hypothetical protein"